MARGQVRHGALFAALWLSLAAVTAGLGTPAQAATPTSDQTQACPEVFSGPQAALSIERWAPPRDNGDGTFTMSYALVESRYLGSTDPTVDAAYDCAFVDANRSGLYDGGEPLFGVVKQPATFSAATSSSTRFVLEVTVAAQPGDQVCDRAQVNSSYNGGYKDKSQYYCETLPPPSTGVPAGGVGAMSLGLVLAVPLLFRRGRRRSPTP